MSDRETKKIISLASAMASIQRHAGPRLNLEELAGDLAKGLSTAFGPAGCAVFLIDDQNTNILAEIGFQANGNKRAFSSDMPAMEYFSRHKRGIRTTDIQRSPFADISSGDKATSLICSPVMAHNELRGLLYISAERPDCFPPEDLEVLELLAREISVVIELSHLHDKVDELTVRDGLTGCFTRRKFEEDLEIEIPCAERYGRPLSLLILDIDCFSSYNAIHGQTTGDRLLGKVGEVLRYSIRMCDKLYRYGGDQFALLLPGINKEQAVFAARRIRNVLEKQRFEGEEESQPQKKLTFSFGVSSFPADAVFKDGLLKAAYAELQRAKNSGENTIS